jgi:hypothetical protein
MADVRATRLTVRVQARGGKFLGDDIGGAVVMLRDAQTGELLATGTTAGGSGTLSPSYAANVAMTVTLAFNQTHTSGLFAGTWQMPSNRTTDPIFYEAIVSARQLSTGNVGTGTVTFFSNPAPSR